MNIREETHETGLSIQVAFVEDTFVFKKINSKEEKDLFHKK